MEKSFHGIVFWYVKVNLNGWSAGGDMVPPRSSLLMIANGSSLLDEWSVQNQTKKYIYWSPPRQGSIKPLKTCGSKTSFLSREKSPSTEEDFAFSSFHKDLTWISEIRWKMPIFLSFICKCTLRETWSRTEKGTWDENRQYWFSYQVEALAVTIPCREVVVQKTFSTRGMPVVSGNICKDWLSLPLFSFEQISSVP